MNIRLVSGEKDVTQLNFMLKQYMDEQRTRETMANTPNINERLTFLST